MTLTLRERVSLILRGDFEGASTQRPFYDRATHQLVARQARAEHGLSPFDSARKQARAERFRLWLTPSTPMRCGASEGSDLLIPSLACPREQALVIHHERSHGWWVRRGDPEATEGDSWFLTLDFIAPADELDAIARGPDPLVTLADKQHGAPPWFLRLALERYYRSRRLDPCQILGPEKFYR